MIFGCYNVKQKSNLILMSKKVL